jgi:hypothetical protein
MSKEKYKLRDGRVVEIETADGSKGFLLQGPSGRMFFRIYDSADKRKFRDFPIAHFDMQIEIQDNGAYFYYDDKGKMWLDYSPAALGLEKDESNSQ